MESKIIKYFEILGFDIITSEKYTIWFSLTSKNGFTLQFIYFIDDRCIYCRLLHDVVNKDVFDGFILNDVKELDYLVKNNKHITSFYRQHEAKNAQ